jgi:hypothetical protein
MSFGAQRFYLLGYDASSKRDVSTWRDCAVISITRHA